MGLQCHYNVYLVEQFFSTLAFEDDARLTMRWMTRNNDCIADFYQFVEILGYSFEGPVPMGIAFMVQIALTRTRARLIFAQAC